MKTGTENIKRVPLRHLYFSFAGIGAVMFGGGYAMLPLLEREVVDRRRWCTHQEMAEYYAIAQVIPGVIAVNISMLIGSRYRGVLGAATAAVATVTAPFFTILILAIAFKHMAVTSSASAVFAGLRPAVAGLILAAAWGLLKRGCRNFMTLFLAVVAAGLMASKITGPVGLILAGVAAGCCWHLWSLSKMRRALHQRKLKSEKGDQ
jgi:chromate transporter